MPPRIRQRLVAHFSEPSRPEALIGWAAGLGLLPALLIRLPIKNLGPYGRALVELLLSAAASGVAAGATILARHAYRASRRFAEQHPRAVRVTVKAAVVCAVLLAVAGAVALGWSGELAGAVATVAAKAVLACAVGVGAAVSSLGWVLVRVRHPVMRYAAVALGLYLSASCFLLFEHQSVGEKLLLIPMIVSFLWTAVMRGTSAGPGAILGALLLLTVAAWHQDLGPGSPATRALAQVVVAGLLGTATVRLVRRSAGRRERLRRFAGTAAIVPLACVLFLLFDDQLLGGPLEAPVFALMVWLVVRLWRWMQEHDRTLVSAAADIVFALLLGAVLVLLLVWLANLLNLPAAEVKALRGIAGNLGNLVDLPWWLWAIADVLLTAAFLTAALRPRRFRRITEALGRIRVPGALDIVRRTLSVVRIGLLALVFLGLAAPPTVGPLLSQRIRSRYTVALQADLTARGEIAFYQAISSQFVNSPQALPILTEMLVRVHDSAPSRSDQREATPAALDLAHRMGELQAQTVLPFQPDPTRQAPQPPTATAVRDAGMDGTAANSADLDARLTGEHDEDEHAGEHEHEADHAAEHAAAIVTGALSVVTFGHGVVIGLVREYLDGLAESALHNVFLSWTERAVSRAEPPEPPAATRIVEPDPRSLRRAADFQLTDELLSTGNEPGTDPAQARSDRESPITAAVDLVNHTRGLQLGIIPCTGCFHFPEPGEGGEHGDEDVGGVHGE